QGRHDLAKTTNQKTIGINKLGTLLSSQTTDTFEYFSKQFISMNSFVSHFFAAMFPSYFIHIHFANPGYFPDIHSAE
ncbi:hypothetical protein ACFC25_21110, partial [Pseudarthrobacter sp. NPDC055928]|uniref:hypothetical protein n=1 Tax=Pseudarthrobacter sp. NPDC055928 TaxID=3345661 RepID=UPI0035D7DB79